MSIKTEITRIKTNITNAYTKAEEKGATLPETLNSVNLVNAIDSMKTLDENQVLVGGEHITLDSNIDTTIKGKDRVLVNKDTSIRFNADSIDEKKYNYMINSQGEIVSYWSDYLIPAYCDEFIRAIYSDSEVEKKSLINWIGKGYELDKETSTIHFYITCDILDSEEKLNWHILISSKGLSDDEMVVETEGITDVEINFAPTGKYHTVHFYITSTGNFKRHSTAKVRAYATIVRDGVEEKIYTKVITFQC